MTQIGMISITAYPVILRQTQFENHIIARNLHFCKRGVNMTVAFRKFFQKLRDLTMGLRFLSRNIKV